MESVRLCTSCFPPIVSTNRSNLSPSIYNSVRSPVRSSVCQSFIHSVQVGARLLPTIPFILPPRWDRLKITRISRSQRNVREVELPEMTIDRADYLKDVRMTNLKISPSEIRRLPTSTVPEILVRRPNELRSRDKRFNG